MTYNTKRLKIGSLFKRHIFVLDFFPCPLAPAVEKRIEQCVAGGLSGYVGGRVMPILQEVFPLQHSTCQNMKSLSRWEPTGSSPSLANFTGSNVIVLSFLCFGDRYVPADIYFTTLSDGAAAGAPRSSRDRPSAIEASSPLASRRAVSGAMPAFRAMMRPAASQ